MLRRAGLAGAAMLIAAGAAGCGGGGGGGDSYSLSATRKCLVDAGYPTAELANQYLPGTGGNLRVKLTTKKQLLQPTAPTGVQSRDYVFLVFQKDETAAKQTQAKAVHLAILSLRQSGILASAASVRRGVGLTSNVFYYSTTGSLTQSQRAEITSCLR